MFRYLYKKFFENKPKVRVPHTKGLALTDINIYGEESESRQWIGVDLDGTLAFADPWQGFEHIGKPVPTMLKRVNVWIGSSCGMIDAFKSFQILEIQLVLTPSLTEELRF